jgi:hypothetical protein
VSQKRFLEGSLILLVLIISLTGCGGGSNNHHDPISSETVTIQNKGAYYQVVLNFQNATHQRIGAEYL